MFILLFWVEIVLIEIFTFPGFSCDCLSLAMWPWQFPSMTLGTSHVGPRSVSHRYPCIILGPCIAGHRTSMSDTGFVVHILRRYVLRSWVTMLGLVHEHLLVQHPFGFTTQMLIEQFRSLDRAHIFRLACPDHSAIATWIMPFLFVGGGAVTHNSYFATLMISLQVDDCSATIRRFISYTRGTHGWLWRSSSKSVPLIWNEPQWPVAAGRCHGHCILDPSSSPASYDVGPLRNILCWTRVGRWALVHIWT